MPDTPIALPRRPRRLFAVAATTLALLAGCASRGPQTNAAAASQCLPPAAISEWAHAYQARAPLADPPTSLSAADAACTRDRLLAQLAPGLGPLVGYKAGLTNAAVQQRFGANQPVWGALYAHMLLSSGARVPAQFGSRPVFESDLLVRVRSSAINQARTPAEVMASIDQITPFIELPDLLVQHPAQLNAASITALNVGARLGVVGTPIAVPADPARQQQLADALRDMVVRVQVAQSGEELARGKGSDLLGHPLQAVVWLAGALRQQGRGLQAGQIISLGSFSPLLPPHAGQRIVVRYDGLPGAQPVWVEFQ